MNKTEMKLIACIIGVILFIVGTTSVVVIAIYNAKRYDKDIVIQNTEELSKLNDSGNYFRNSSEFNRDMVNCVVKKVIVRIMVKDSTLKLIYDLKPIDKDTTEVVPTIIKEVIMNRNNTIDINYRVNDTVLIKKNW